MLFHLWSRQAIHALFFRCQTRETVPPLPWLASPDPEVPGQEICAPSFKASMLGNLCSLFHSGQAVEAAPPLQLLSSPWQDLGWTEPG